MHPRHGLELPLIAVKEKKKTISYINDVVSRSTDAPFFTTVDAHKERCFSYKKMGISAKSVDTDLLAVLSAFEVSPCGPEPDCRAEIEGTAIVGHFITEFGRVRMWRGGLRYSLSVAAPFVWRCPNSRTITPFPHPPHRNGHADFPHPALGQDTYLCTRKVIRSTHDKQHRVVLPWRALTERSAQNRQCHHMGGHSLPGSLSGLLLRFSMWRLMLLPPITGVY